LAAAQEAAPAPQPGSRVEIRSDAAAQRRADTAGRQVVARGELLRHGDARLVDALARVPGITVDGRGLGTELQLGGMGSGQTLVLLNGEPLPRGTSLDSIALGSIDRVEITRGSSVQAAQAIAGTINLVTRRPSVQATRELKLQGASRSGRPQASATLNLAGSEGAATWGLGLVVSLEDQVWRATFEQPQARVRPHPGPEPEPAAGLEAPVARRRAMAAEHRPHAARGRLTRRRGRRAPA
jgi:outer membrane receptor protein involved in Fe transport